MQSTLILSSEFVLCDAVHGLCPHSLWVFHKIRQLFLHLLILNNHGYPIQQEIKQRSFLKLYLECVVPLKVKLLFLASFM